MRDKPGPGGGPRYGRRILLFLLGALVWTGVSCYPNPGVFFRNLARYRNLPIAPELGEQMKWQIPERPAEIERLVDGLLLPKTDWELYRVPWYVPTAEEVALSERGDCEAKTILLASLLAGKGIPFEIRASLHHIWVDYAGRRPRPGETREFAYLEGKAGRLGLHWPRQVDWQETVAVQKAQLWEAMPIARMAIWTCGLMWLVLAAMLLGGPGPEGELVSQWRVPIGPWVGRAGSISALILTLIMVGAVLRYGTVRWNAAGVKEVVGCSVVLGSFLAWLSVVRWRLAVSVAANGKGLRVRSALGPWRKERGLEGEEIAYLEAEAAPGGARPWVVRAVLRNTRRAALLRLNDALAARATLRHLGRALGRPIAVRAEVRRTWTEVDEIGLSLGERAVRHPMGTLLVRPASCDLEIVEQEGRWTLRYPVPARGTGSILVGYTAVVVIMAGISTVLLMYRPQVTAVWVMWLLAGFLLAMAIYLALILKDEIVARLAGARVEIGEGELRFHNPEGKVESMPISEIESIELGRVRGMATIAIVSPEHIIHLRGLGAPEHREWLREAIREAVARCSKS